MSEVFLVERHPVATVTINRPERRNAIDYDGWIQLGRLAADLDSDDLVRVVVFTGAGDKAFSAGADIADFDKHRNDSAQARVYGDAIDGALEAVERISKPTIAAIRGFCVGGGCDLAMATDIRVASDDSRFGMPVARLGILVSYNEMRRLAQLIGPGHTSDLLLSGRLIDAPEALRIGLVSRVVPSDEVSIHVEKLATEMSELAPLSHSRHKEMMQAVLSDPALATLTAEQDAIQFANFDSEDFQEGRKAFLERRTPRFRGS